MERLFRRQGKVKRVEKLSSETPKQPLKMMKIENSPKHMVNKKAPQSQPSKYNSVKRNSENCRCQIISGCSSTLTKHKMEQLQDLLCFPQEPAQ